MDCRRRRISRGLVKTPNNLLFVDSLRFISFRSSPFPALIRSFVELESTSSVDEPVTSKILVDSSVLHKEHGVGVVLNVGSKAIVWKDKNGKTRKVRLDKKRRTEGRSEATASAMSNISLPNFVRNFLAPRSLRSSQCPAAELTTTPLSPLNSKPLCASTAETLVTVNVAVATQAAATSINLACTPGPAVESASNAITANVNAEVAVKAAKNEIDIAKSTDSSSAAVAMGVMEAVAKAKEGEIGRGVKRRVFNTITSDKSARACISIPGVPPP